MYVDPPEPLRVFVVKLVAGFKVVISVSSGSAQLVWSSIANLYSQQRAMVRGERLVFMSHIYHTFKNLV